MSAGTLNDVTELVDAFLRPANDKDSLFAFRVTDATRLEDEEVVDWRGTRDTEPVVDGEARTEWREEGSFVFAEGVSKTPNSLEISWLAVGESLDGVVSLTWVLARRLLSVGEVTVEDRLAIRGIFVGVSFDNVNDVLFEDNGGPSFDDV